MTTVHLNRYFHFTQLMRDPTIECQLLRYRSDYDRALQTIFIMKPKGRRAQSLFFFFHGMDGDSGDGVVVRDLAKRLDATVISMGGRGPSWVSDAFFFDAGHVIAKYSAGFRNYYLIGISMGGTQALALPALLNKELRNKMSGVIAIMPGFDLKAIALESSNRRVRETLVSSVNGDISKLSTRSPVHLTRYYKKNLPFVIFYNENDTLLLPGKSRKYISILAKRNSVSIFTAPGEHNFTYTNFDYKKIFEALGKKSIKKKVLQLPT